MLTKEKLQKIIDQFDQDELKSQGIFGILQYGGGSDESYVRANKEGLELFALELLKSARDSEDLLLNGKKNTILFDNEESWVDANSDTFIQYVELITDKQQIKLTYKLTFGEKLILFGFKIIGITILISVFVGLITMLNWFF